MGARGAAVVFWSMTALLHPASSVSANPTSAANIREMALRTPAHPRFMLVTACRPILSGFGGRGQGESEFHKAQRLAGPRSQIQETVRTTRRVKWHRSCGNQING